LYAKNTEGKLAKHLTPIASIAFRKKEENWLFFLAIPCASAYFAPGEMAERSNAAVLKTVDCYRSGGSNPSLSAPKALNKGFFYAHLLPLKTYLFLGSPFS
jgi:hypothetical protein